MKEFEDVDRLNTNCFTKKTEVEGIYQNRNPSFWLMAFYFLLLVPDA
jgi:hypothetical protein